MQKITTFLTYQNQAEEAANLYTSIFKNSKITHTTGSAGTVVSVAFQLNGQAFIALNGGPQFAFAEGISLFVTCENQEEVDELWDKLSEGGEKGPCGWLKDKFGVSWQIIPSALSRMLQDRNPEKSKQVMEAMCQMTKIDIQSLERVYAS